MIANKKASSPQRTQMTEHCELKKEEHVDQVKENSSAQLPSSKESTTVTSLLENGHSIPEASVSSNNDLTSSLPNSNAETGQTVPSRLPLPPQTYLEMTPISTNSRTIPEVVVPQRRAKLRETKSHTETYQFLGSDSEQSRNQSAAPSLQTRPLPLPARTDWTPTSTQNEEASTQKTGITDRSFLDPPELRTPFSSHQDRLTTTQQRIVDNEVPTNYWSHKIPELQKSNSTSRSILNSSNVSGSDDFTRTPSRRQFGISQLPDPFTYTNPPLDTRHTCSFLTIF